MKKLGRQEAGARVKADRADRGDARIAQAPNAGNERRKDPAEADRGQGIQTRAK